MKLRAQACVVGPPILMCGTRWRTGLPLARLERFDSGRGSGRDQCAPACAGGGTEQVLPQDPLVARAWRAPRTPEPALRGPRPYALALVFWAVEAVAFTQSRESFWSLIGALAATGGIWLVLLRVPKIGPRACWAALTFLSAALRPHGDDLVRGDGARLGRPPLPDLRRRDVLLRQAGVDRVSGGRCGRTLRRLRRLVRSQARRSWLRWPGVRACSSSPSS